MELLGVPDPWHDETAQRVHHAVRVLGSMRGENEVERVHFPEWRRQGK
jgi:hypothetical protein